MLFFHTIKENLFHFRFAHPKLFLEIRLKTQNYQRRTGKTAVDRYVVVYYYYIPWTIIATPRQQLLVDLVISS